MKKTAFLALLLAMLLPAIGYVSVKYYSKDAVHMPRKYFYDSIAVQTAGGKSVNDTVWHQVQSIAFTNQDGKKVSLDDLHGKIIVLDFFFTRCPVVCPGLTRNMKRLQDSFKQSDSIVQFVSVSIDPAYDSAQNLRKFANHYNANFDNWWFLTGNKEDVYKFALGEIKASVADTKIDTAFIHTENFFLIDTNRVIRGFYNGLDTLRLAELARDIPTLMLERDKKSPSILREFIPILPIIFGGIAFVFIIMGVINRKKNKTDANTNN